MILDILVSIDQRAPVAFCLLAQPTSFLKRIFFIWLQVIDKFFLRKHF